MSIWGKLIGGGIGFAFGGPIGALIGVWPAMPLIALSRGTRKSSPRSTTAARPVQKQIAFTIGVIVLGAKMAKADGVVTEDEIRAFREVFQVPEDEIKNVARVFNQAKQDATGYEPYARQIAGMFKNDPEVLEDLLSGLMHITRADNVVHPNEVAFLKSVAEIFGISEQDYAACTPPISDLTRMIPTRCWALTLQLPMRRSIDLSRTDQEESPGPSDGSGPARGIHSGGQ